MSGAPVRLEIEGRIARLVLDSPPFNLFDVGLRDGLIEGITAVRDIPTIAVMVLESAGDHFSAGADLTEFGGAAHVLEGRRIRWDRDPWGLLIDLPVPTVAALRGVVLGSGFEMSLLCDVRIAAANVRIGLPETALGTLPAAGGTQSLTHAIGPHAALPIVAESRHLEAAEALGRGLVHRVVPVNDLEAATDELAGRLAARSRVLHRAARRALRAASDLPLVQGLQIERQIAETFRSS